MKIIWYTFLSSAGSVPLYSRIGKRNIGDKRKDDKKCPNLYVRLCHIVLTCRRIIYCLCHIHRSKSIIKYDIWFMVCCVFFFFGGKGNYREWNSLERLYGYGRDTHKTSENQIFTDKVPWNVNYTHSHTNFVDPELFYLIVDDVYLFLCVFGIIITYTCRLIAWWWWWWLQIPHIYASNSVWSSTICEMNGE